MTKSGKPDLVSAIRNPGAVCTSCFGFRVRTFGAPRNDKIKKNGPLFFESGPFALSRERAIATAVVS
jgi:hypothetical protein